MTNADLDGSRRPSDSSDADTADQTRRFAAALGARVHYRDAILAAARSRKHVVFYGCGIILDSIVETWMQFVGVPIDFCCDSDAAKWGKTFCGARCLSPRELAAMKDDCAVFVTIGNFGPVVNELLAAGFPTVRVVYKYDLVNDEYLDHRDVASVADELGRARALMHDERSRRVFDAIVRRVVSGGADWNLMADICEGDQYFPTDVVTLSDRERFVDIGAFDGDTVSDFIRRTGGHFDRIDAFELDRANFEHLRNTVSRLPQPDRIRIFNLGAWDREQDVTYSVGRSQSTVGGGETVGHVVTLDAALRGDPVTFIKFDIEGAEPQALRGAREIISTQRPTLAVCVYHHFSHLWEIPLFIHELVPGHRIYLRHHTRLEYETVCYAVPPTT